MDEVDFDRELEGTTKLITSLNINQESASLKPGLLMMNTIHYRGSIHFFLGRFPFDRTGRPDHCSTSQFENKIGFFQEFLLKDHLLRAYYSVFD